MSSTASQIEPPLPAPDRTLEGSPFGIAWFFLYGHAGVPAARYLPALRGLGADFTKVYLFWQQIEPEKGRFDWTAVDAFVDQLQSPEEGLISLFTASQWATAQASAMLPPSPAKDLDDYYRFVFETVKHCRGRVRYWQNDAEPNNPVFWAGDREQFVAHLQVFHRAVKAADPAALVVVGGYDGMFIPPGMTPLSGQRTTPFPQQEEGLKFFDHVLQAGGRFFDVFDLRLYGDPYTITARVEHMRGRMRAFGCNQPMICTEYGGPSLFEFPENRGYRSLVTRWSQAAADREQPGNPAGATEVGKAIAALYAQMPALPPQTQMFMQGCPPEFEARHQRIQARGIVMRNLFALSAGVERLLYWDLLSAPGKRDDLMTLMYGKIGLLGIEDGELKKRTLSAEAYARMARLLAGVRRVRRIPVPAHPSVCLFEVDRGPMGTVYVVWERRDLFSGEDAPPVTCAWPADSASPCALDALGNEVPVCGSAGRIELPVSATPIYVLPKSSPSCRAPVAGRTDTAAEVTGASATLAAFRRS